MAGSNSLLAQQSINNLFTNNVFKGDAMYLDLYYDQAIKYYKQALKKDPANKPLKLKIAASYRMLGAYEASLSWYEQAFQEDFETSDSVHNYYYAEVLTSAGRYDDAHSYYRKFWSQAPTDSRASRKLDGIARIDVLFRDSAAIEINSLPINSEYDDLAAVPTAKNVLFLSSRPLQSLTDQDFLRDENPLDVFTVNYDSTGTWGEPSRMPQGLNSNFYEGPLAMDASGKQLILSRSNIILGKPILSSEGKTNVQLFQATKAGNEWIVGKKLPFCNSEFSYAHPTLNERGDTLYFVSDMDGGYGGNDLYMSILKDNEWGEPANLGYMINTEGEERNPFFIAKRLFFSSNGHGGIGGYDVFKAYMKNGLVDEIVNVGYPINSPADDFAYYIDRTTLKGMLTSNRAGGLGKDDIYSFDTKARILTGVVFQEQDKSLIQDAEVKLIQDGKEIASSLTNQDGEFNFQLPIEEDFIIMVSKEDHKASMPLFIPRHYYEIDMDTLMVALHKDDLFARGRILNNETQQLMDSVRVVLHNATDNVFDTLLTDSKGTYSFVLDPNKSFNIWATKSGFLFGGADINTMEIDSGVITNDIVLELEYSKKSVVNFDFDEYKLKPEAVAVLRRTATAMRRTNYQLIISAFADARGTVEYNQALSDKRAAAVLDYFIKQGIDESRIIARGFGESLILNRCVDGVNCEEVEHSKNRRAEIKIEGSNVK